MRSFRADSLIVAAGRRSGGWSVRLPSACFYRAKEFPRHDRQRRIDRQTLARPHNLPATVRNACTELLAPRTDAVIWSSAAAFPRAEHGVFFRWLRFAGASCFSPAPALPLGVNGCLPS